MGRFGIFALTLALAASAAAVDARDFASDAGRVMRAAPHRFHAPRFSRQPGALPAFFGDYDLGDGAVTAAAQTVTPPAPLSPSAPITAALPPCQEVAAGGVTVMRGSACSR
jgi:hypothetical protein